MSWGFKWVKISQLLGCSGRAGWDARVTQNWGKYLAACDCARADKGEAAGPAAADNPGVCYIKHQLATLWPSLASEAGEIRLIGRKAARAAVLGPLRLAVTAEAAAPDLKLLRCGYWSQWWRSVCVCVWRRTRESSGRHGTHQHQRKFPNTVPVLWWPQDNSVSDPE